MNWSRTIYLFVTGIQSDKLSFRLLAVTSYWSVNLLGCCCFCCHSWLHRHLDGFIFQCKITSASEVYWWNSGISIIGVSKHLLNLWFNLMTATQVQTLSWHCYLSYELMTRNVMGPKRKPAIILLLSEHIIKPTSTELWLYPEISASSANSNERSFFLTLD